MTGSDRSEKIKEIISNFISNPKTQPEFLKVVAAIDKRYRYKLGFFYDKERHSTIQLVLDCFEKITNDQRHWDFENVKFEAVLYNAARSLIGNEVRKEKDSRSKMAVYTEKPDIKKSYGILTDEDALDFYMDIEDEFDSGFNNLYDREIIKMVQTILKKDKTALSVMEELMASDSNIKISETLGITVTEAENARKRIRRAGERVLLVLSTLSKRPKEEIRREILRRDKV